MLHRPVDVECCTGSHFHISGSPPCELFLVMFFQSCYPSGPFRHPGTRPRRPRLTNTFPNGPPGHLFGHGQGLPPGPGFASPANTHPHDPPNRLQPGLLGTVLDTVWGLPLGPGVASRANTHAHDPPTKPQPHRTHNLLGTFLGPARDSVLTCTLQPGHNSIANAT